jgi:hypothetical protein
MKRTFILIPLLAAALAIAGCENKPSSSSSTDKETPKAGGPPVDSPKIQEALAKLSPEDRALAEAQRVCPKSGMRLGSMGTPVKLMLKGEPVFICCSSCKEEVDKDPDAALKKVGANKKK